MLIVFRKVGPLKKEPKTTTTIADMDLLFLETPEDEYFCPVTFNLLLKPNLTSCCGNHISDEAKNELMKTDKPCPICKKTEWNASLNKRFQREVRLLLVFCPNRVRGCGFMTTIAELSKHMKQCSHKDSQLTTTGVGKVWIKALNCNSVVMFTGYEILLVQNESIIINELIPARRKSYELGLALNIHGMTVASNQVEQKKLLSQVVHEFLKQPCPSWRVIVQALRSPLVKCETLAEKLEKKFCFEGQKKPVKGKYSDIRNTLFLYMFLIQVIWKSVNTGMVCMWLTS